MLKPTKPVIAVGLFCFLFISSLLQAQTSTTASDVPRPKLVVGIVVDQMRWDYLYRYHARYGSGGFKRMLREGFTCENLYIDYVPTVTAIGHSTIYTGTVPAIHGIAGNDFIENATGRSIYCTEDSTVTTVGSTSKAGHMSPRNLLSTTISDELRLATNFRSKSVGIAIKDRGAILPAGHSATAAYWFDDLTGNWITSTFYMNELPAWVTELNNRKLVEKYMKQDWKPLYDIKSYNQSTADDVRYEGKIRGQQPTLPLKTSGMLNNGFGMIRNTPYGNTITLDIAKAAIENEKLGQRGVTDILALSFSSPDYIGHHYGPNSIEVEDTYLRLDRELAQFFSYLDTRLGQGQYTVFLSSDHGAAHNQNFLIDNKIPAGMFPSGQLKNDLNAMLEQEFNVKNLVLSLSNYQVHFDMRAVEAQKIDEIRMRKLSVDFLKRQPNVSFAVDVENIGQAPIPEELKMRIINGHNFKRSGPIQMILDPGWFPGSGTGTTHGSWNSYDSHIPMVWMGWGIKQGKSTRKVNMSDIAPTIAVLLQIQEPNGSIGKPISEVLK